MESGKAKAKIEDFVERSGDNRAAPTEKGSGPAHATVDDTAFGAQSAITHRTSHPFELDRERSEEDGIGIVEAGDGRLGLTNTETVPADDWAADSGPTENPDGER